ncbi:DUF2252 domain-containing protein [Chitinophaga nivalis]|uniref:DUF2252 domain-containing protein n=1 Tax=Chitinophaga nivalis TaxID=2991709 RepID=A0ABT3ISB9_9BACT|nr:DUF2252 domain-containing protein [Chitinophaga nivalis]MCW3463432.1 DUF2252 domain-containing protein [Chitinophaga nivalis]MCW3486878.1 DUF2252 domain-containing protein [Chitinophaga nivalis]
MSDPKENAGKKLRDQVPRTSQGLCKLSPKRPSALSIIEAGNIDRVTNLIPIRHGRMSVSPFAFYRGTAAVMAQDLAFLPHTALEVQATGDCHLMNFGGFATPERTLIFDVNDFDETLPAPWEWDIKRLATSFVLAARNNQLKDTDAEDMAVRVAASYRKSLYEFSQLNKLDLWYMKFEMHHLMEQAANDKVKQLLKTAIDKAEKSTQQKIFYKTTRNESGSFEIADQPPLIYHPLHVAQEKDKIRSFMEQYMRTLQDDRRFLVSQYEVIDVALKVVGVGSVGTRCLIALLMNNKDEPLFLQVKEARKSVLEAFMHPSQYAHCGERIVQGQRLVQAASDIFLGWSTGDDNRHYYVRQLRDRKIAPDVESFDKEILGAYADLCGRVLARAHAKTGDAATISNYMGKSEVLEGAIGVFAVAYANQTEKDYQAFKKAIKAGKIPVEMS